VLPAAAYTGTQTCAPGPGRQRQLRTSEGCDFSTASICPSQSEYWQRSEGSDLKLLTALYEAYLARHETAIFWHGKKLVTKLHKAVH